MSVEREALPWEVRIFQNIHRAGRIRKTTWLPVRGGVVQSLGRAGSPQKGSVLVIGGGLMAALARQPVCVHGGVTPFGSLPMPAFDMEFRLREIERVAGALSQLPHKHLGPQGTQIFDIEWYALAAIKKTASLSHAFCTLVRAKNMLSAAALVRLQLDTAMRMFGLSLVDDVDAAGTRLMNDESYRKLRSRTGEPLTDAFLHQKLNEKYPGLSEAYEAASAYVHLSGVHIKTGLWSREGTPTLFFHLNGTDESRPSDWFADIIDSFDQATRLTADLITGFMTTRPDIGTRPQTRGVGIH